MFANTCQLLRFLYHETVQDNYRGRRFFNTRISFRSLSEMFKSYLNRNTFNSFGAKPAMCNMSLWVREDLLATDMMSFMVIWLQNSLNQAWLPQHSWALSRSCLSSHLASFPLPSRIALQYIKDQTNRMSVWEYYKLVFKYRHLTAPLSCTPDWKNVPYKRSMSPVNIIYLHRFPEKIGMFHLENLKKLSLKVFFFGGGGQICKW